MSLSTGNLAPKSAALSSKTTAPSPFGIGNNSVVSPFGIGGAKPISPFGMGGSKPVSPLGIGQQQNMSVAPATNMSIAPPATARPAAASVMSSTSSPGTYNHIRITPGSDADIQAQMAKIDSIGTAPATPSPAAPVQPAAPAQPTTPVAPTTPAPPPPPSYSGLVGNLVSNAGLTAQSGQMTPQEVADRQHIASLEAQRSQTLTGGASQGYDAVAQGGLLGVVNRNVENQESALNQEIAALTAQRTAAQGAYTAAGSQLSEAAGYAKPSATAQGQTTFDPLTGKFSGGSYQDNLKTIVDSIRSGNIGYTDGVNSLAGISPTAKADVLAALGQGFDTVNSDAQAANRATNTRTSGTAQTGAYAGVYDTATKQAATISQQRSAINDIGNQAMTLLKNNPELNKFASQHGNKALNKLSTELSSPQYAAFNTAIQSLRARIGSALQAGEIPTAATSGAQSIANGDITLDALGSTLVQVDKEMGTFQDSQQALADYARGQMGSGGGNAAGSSVTSPGASTYKSPSGATYTLPY